MRDDAAHGSGGFEAARYVLQADASTGALTLRARRAAHLDWTTGILGGHHSFGISHIDGAAGRIGNDHIAGLNNADAATGRRATNRSFYLLNGDVTAACFEKRFAADGARLNRAATRCAMNGSGDLAEKDITACSPGVYATGDSIEIHAPSAGFGPNGSSYVLSRRSRRSSCRAARRMAGLALMTSQSGNRLLAGRASVS